MKHGGTGVSPVRMFEPARRRFHRLHAGSTDYKDLSAMLTLNRVPLCQLDDLPVGLGRAFEVDGKSIAIFRTRAGRIFAVDAFCPHKGGPLADGMLAGESVVCPYHAFRFDADTGDCDQPGICSIATYPVEATDAGIVVTI